MKKKHKQALYLILAIAIIGVMAFAYFFATDDESQLVQAGETVQGGSVQLLNRSESDVVSISFWTQDSLSYMLPYYGEDGSRRWSYSVGEGFLLNQSRIRDKARPAWALSVPEVLHENTEGLNLGDFGLSPAKLVMEVSFYDGTSHSIRIGSQTTDLRHYFLMIDNDPAIYLITSFVAERMMSDISDLIDLSLPFFDFDMATYVSIRQRDREPIEFSLLGPVPVDHPPGWNLVMTQPFYGFDTRMIVLDEDITLARLLHVASVYPESLDDYGLSEPRLEFEFHSIYDEITLLLGSTFVDDETEYIYVKIEGRPHVFVAEYRYMQALFDLNPLDFILRIIMLVHIVDIYAVTLHSVNENENFVMIINHEGGDSTAINPTINGVEVTDAEFRTVYQTIIGLSVDSPVAAFTPDDEPRLTLTYHFIEQDNRNIRLFYRDAQFYYVSLDGGDVHFVINRRAVERMISGIQNLLL